MVDEADEIYCARPQSAFAIETLGRVLRIGCGSGAGRFTLHEPVVDLGREIFGRYQQSDRRADYPPDGAYEGCFFRAYVLDPSFIEPYLNDAEFCNHYWSLHQSWRAYNGDIFSRLFDSERLLSRPEILHFLVELLLSLHHEVGAYRLVELLFARAMDEGSYQSWDFEVQSCVLLRAQCALAVGSTVSDWPGAESLGGSKSRFAWPVGRSFAESLQAEAKLIEAYAALVEGRREEGFLASFSAAIGGWQRASTKSQQRCLSILQWMARDPRSQCSDLVARYLEIAPMGTAGSYPSLLIQSARIEMELELGMDIRADWEDFKRAYSGLANKQGLDASFESAYLCVLRFLAKSGSDQTAIYTEALRIGAGFNKFYNEEELLILAQKVIVAYLAKLGRQDLLMAFKPIDPVAELWERREWVPPEIHGWLDSDRKIAGAASRSLR